MSENATPLGSPLIKYRISLWRKRVILVSGCTFFFTSLVLSADERPVGVWPPTSLISGSTASKRSSVSLMYKPTTSPTWKSEPY